MSDFLSLTEIKKLSLRSFGKNLKISKSVIFINPKNISIGNNVRIDAFTMIAAKNHLIKIGNYIHIGVGCYINGSYGLEMDDYVGLSTGSKILTSSDDYSGNYMTNPTIPSELTNATNKKVILSKYVNIGANSILMPGIKIFEGSVVGVFSYVPKDLKSWGIYFGIPVKRIGERSKKIIKLSSEIINE